MFARQQSRQAEGERDMLRAALAYAGGLGWRVLPVWPVRGGRCGCGRADCPSPGKHPIARLVPNGLKDASADVDVVRGWWESAPDANVATVDFLRVDVDARAGGLESWEELAAQFGRVETVECFTPGGGRHFYFRQPAGWEPTNKTGKLPAGIDIRGEGRGYTLLPPSNHVNGRYEWEASSGPHQLEPVELPAWLADLLRPVEVEEPRPRVDVRADEAVDLERLGLKAIHLAAIKRAPEAGEDRSQIDQSVISALVAHGATDGQIAHIFRTYPIGAAGKFAERGESYLEMSVASARQWLAGQGGRVNGNGHGPDIAAGRVREGADPVISVRAQTLAGLLAEEMRPLEWMVDGLVARGHLVMIAGRPKSGKTWLVLQLAQSVDEGRAFLGKATTRGRVLLVTLEDGPRRLRSRVEMLGWRPSSAEVLFDLAHLDGDGITAGPGLRQLNEMAASYDLIVIDTLIAGLSGRADENSNTAMAAIANDLAAIARASNAAIVLVHHTSKGSHEDVFHTIRGASALRGAYDVGMVLERKKEEREGLLHVESKDIDGGSYTIRQGEGGAGWQLVGGAVELRKIRAGRQVVKTLMEHGDGVTTEDLAKTMGITRQAANQQLLAAEAQGLVRRKKPDVEQLEMLEGGQKKKADVWYLM